MTSFSTDRGINFRRFFPAGYTLDNYINILFHSDSVAQFPRWFMNTFVVACFNCVISTCFVLMVAYALSCCRFKGRKLLQNLSVIVNLFPGVLPMSKPILVYTIISSFMVPWTDFVMAKMILNSGVSADRPAARTSCGAVCF